MRSFRWLYICFFCCSVLVSACVNDIEKIKKITFKENDPEEKTSELFLTYTDSGMAKIRLYAPLAESFTKPEKIIQFREGLKVEFYNQKGTLSSILTAQYGEINEAKGTMEVRDSVRMFNPIKNQTLETEALFWTKKDSTIFTDKFVVVRTTKALIMGEGIRTKQDFSWYEFVKPRGKFNIDSKK
jgi:LPS export ABC transporter protein LptC